MCGELSGQATMFSYDGSADQRLLILAAVALANRTSFECAATADA